LVTMEPITVGEHTLIGVEVKLPKTTLLSISTSRGYIMCGAYYRGPGGWCTYIVTATCCPIGVCNDRSGESRYRTRYDWCRSITSNDLTEKRHKFQNTRGPRPLVFFACIWRASLLIIIQTKGSPCFVLHAKG